MKCKTCGDDMLGDGYTTAIHCANADPTGREPDADPMHCIIEEHSNCPDCDVEPGQQHRRCCDVARCPECGLQQLMHRCETDLPPSPWTGEWPGLAECREFGWYAKLVPGEGWVRCAPTEAGASEDLDRLCREAVWDKQRQRWVKAGE